MVNLNPNSNSNYSSTPSYPLLTPKPNHDLTFASPYTTFPQAFSANSLCDLTEAHFFKLGPRDPNHIGRVEKRRLGTRQDLTHDALTHDS